MTWKATEIARTYLWEDEYGNRIRHTYATGEGRRFPEFGHGEELQGLEIVSGTPDWRKWLPIMAAWRLRKSKSLVTVCNHKHARLYARLAQRVPDIEAELIKIGIVHCCPCGREWTNDAAVKIYKAPTKVYHEQRSTIT